MDCASSNGSTDACVDAIGPPGGRVAATLPFSDETKSRRADVEVEFSLAYTVLGNAGVFANEYPFPALPQDTNDAYKWSQEELPQLLDGWDTAKGGSPKYKAQKIRVMNGGLDNIMESFEIMRDGGYSAEKLVYPLT